ncbi:MAG: lecithin retinol acyltransferase family protein [Gammaproteobacteria bacterium]
MLNEEDGQINLDPETNDWFTELQHNRDLMSNTEACCFYAYKYNHDGQTSPRRRAVETVMDKGHTIFPGTYLREPLLGNAIPLLRGYHHDSIYVGQDQIVEVLGDRKITERIISINEILDWVPAWEGGVFKGTLSFGINQIVGGENADVVRRANEHVGWMWKYHITLNNCQHFAGWCLDEEFFSDEGTNPLIKKERCSETVNLPYLGLVPRWRRPL